MSAAMSGSLRGNRPIIADGAGNGGEISTVSILSRPLIDHRGTR